MAVSNSPAVELWFDQSLIHHRQITQPFALVAPTAQGRASIYIKAIENRRIREIRPHQADQWQDGETGLAWDRILARVMVDRALLT